MKNYIWGTGRKCKDLLMSGALDLTTIEGFVETQKCGDLFENKPIFSLEELNEYDYLIIAIKRNDSIYELCNRYRMDLKKVCFVFPCRKENDEEKNISIAKTVMTDIGYRLVCEYYGKSNIDWIEEDARKYQNLNKRSTFEIKSENNFYITSEKYEAAGNITSYFWQDLWAAKKIIKSNPTMHYDIGSRVDGFIAHLLAADVNVNLIDIRPLDLLVDNLSFTCADATNLDNVEDESIESLSALCSLEHFGLGRYGDPIDPEACFKCFDAIQRKVKSGGNIYISVPIGKEHIEFNAHRVFYAKTIIDCFSDCELVEFSSTKNDFYEENIDVHEYDRDASLGGARFGLFHLRKMV